jgi:adenylate cyclase
MAAVSKKPHILVVDDMPDNLRIVRIRLEASGYAVDTAADGEEALAKIEATPPDLVLLDVMMPKLDGIEVARRVKTNRALPFIPIVLLTAKSDPKDVVQGLDAGADEYLTKPVDHGALMARVRAMLRFKGLHDMVEAQRKELEAQGAALAELNRTLEARVNQQVEEIGRIGRLKRFLAPQLAEMIVSAGDESVLAHHRRDIVALFCDLRGFTALAETSEPEDLMQVLAEYHEALGPLIHARQGTLDRFLGDGLLVYFNDPVPVPDAPMVAVDLAIAMRAAVDGLKDHWRKRGFALGFGVGVAQGYATLGRIGFDGRDDYTAIGTVTNVAARLASEATDRQILITSRVANAIADRAQLESIGELALKGLSRPVAVSNIIALAP